MIDYEEYTQATQATIWTREAGKRTRHPWWRTVQFHPLSAAFPPCSPDEFEMIAASIDRDGVVSPVWLYKTKLLDGRIRAFIADRLSSPDRKIEVRFRVADPNDDPRALLYSLNGVGRHMSPGQIELADRLLEDER